MNVVAPPRPPPVSDPVGDSSCEALIQEAKERARRRRRRHGGVAVAVAIAALAGFATIGGTPSDGVPVGTTTPPEAAAPVVADPDGASTVIASWGNMWGGWVLVYGDGRVISQSGFAGYHGILERRLSPLGLQLVRSGEIRLRPLGAGYDLDSREDVWADPELDPYVPSRYAVLPHVAPSRVDSTDVIDQLPPAAQDLLRGTQQPFIATPIDDQMVFGQVGEPEPVPEAPVDWWVVTSAQARTLVQIFSDPGVDTRWIDTDPVLGDPWGIHFVSADGNVLWLGFAPILPHGGSIPWGL